MIENCKLITLEIINKISDGLCIDLKNYESINNEYVQQLINEALKNSDEVIKKRVHSEFSSCGPIDPLLDNPSISEILINGFNEVWYEENGIIQKYDDHFLSEVTFSNFIVRLSIEADFEVSTNIPHADASWRGHRVHIITPPAASKIYISIRKRKLNPWTLDQFHKLEWASLEDINLIRDIVRNKRNFVVVGGTSSGKTSVLNACLNELSATERALIIEDTQELFLPNIISANILTRIDPKNILQPITQADLLKQALRMRPDRIIMGEVRGAEAKDLLMAFATGHEGSMGTLHANTAQEALLRLEMLIQIGAPQWSINAIRRLIQLALNYIIVVKKNNRGCRLLEGIYKISSLEDFGFLTEKVSCSSFFH